MHNLRIKSAKAGSCPKQDRPCTSGIDKRFRNYLDYFSLHRTLEFDEEKIDANADILSDRSRKKVMKQQ